MSAAAPLGPADTHAAPATPPGRSGDRWWRMLGLDLVTALSLLVLVLFGIPATLVVGPLGAAGTPANILGLLMLGVWTVNELYRVHLGFLDTAIRRALFVWLLADLASYVMAVSRPISTKELNSSDRLMISLCAWVGVLLACGGIRSWDRLVALTRRVVLGGGLVALLGLAQAATHQVLVNVIQIPGLTSNSTDNGFVERAGFLRPSGTATQALEFGIVLTAVLPLAVHHAVTDRQLSWFRRLWPLLAIGAAIPVSLSRSAVLGTLVAFVVILPTWPRQHRRIAYGALLAAVGLVYVSVPGLVEAILSQFGLMGKDNSISSRTDSYSLVLSLFAKSPLIGRGLGTFIPDYRIVDNQLLLILVEAGLVGLLAFLGLIAAAARTGLRGRRRLADPDRRSLLTALVASLLAAAICFATIDAFAFPMLSVTVFLVMGCIDAAWRMASQPAVPGEPVPGEPAVGEPVPGESAEARA
ncbi:MAG TPA: O-antigen ligase family protein [Kineosporiaceae bacterium]|nr:O-antigen ligase family protein [Kineosporiaceae bacterium]